MIDCMKELLNNKHIISTTDGDLCLKDKDSKMIVTLTQISYSGSVITIGIPGSGVFHIGGLKKSQGLRIACDYLVLIQNSSLLKVYFVEMKGNINIFANLDKACDQILHTIPIWDYLVSMAKIHCAVGVKVKKHFAIIWDPKSERLNKQRVSTNVINTHIHKGEKFTIIRLPTGRIPIKALEGG